MENPLVKQKNKLRRAAKLISILGKHGFEDLKAKISNSSEDNSTNSTATLGQQTLFYERIRKVLEDLGPTYVKFGQTLSTREDLLPSELILELKKLQDNVPTEPMDIRDRLEEELDIIVDDVFQHVDAEPFASASIAQVYKATLKNGEQVILKVKRSGIRDVVTADLMLLKDIISLLMSYYPLVREINLPYIFEAFEKNILEELSFHNELQNIQQFARNFADEPRVKCMKAYPELSTDNIICISWIAGVRITNLEALRTQQLDIEAIVDRGLDLYLTQVIEHGFFHADPHPGNLLVTPTGRIAFIDLGAMARLLPKDQEQLENFILYFINKDAENLIRTIKKMSVHIAIKNEKVLVRDIQAMFDMIATQSLQELDIKAVFSRFSKILNQNDILMPDHVYLLVRGIVLLEGIARALLPNLNILDKVKPYITKIMAKRLSPPYLMASIMDSVQQLQGSLRDAPKSLLNLLHKVEQGELKVRLDSPELESFHKQQRKDHSVNRYLYLSCVTFIGACLLVNVDQGRLLGLPWITWVFFLISLIVFLIGILRKAKID